MLDLNPLKTALEDVKRELLAARSAQEQLANRIESLQAEARGLELAIARHTGQSGDATGESSSRWRRMNRTDAVLAVLTDSEIPLGAAGITRVLHEHGRDDPRDHVAATLAYLKNKGSVEHHEDIGKYSVEADSDTRSLGFEGGDSP